MKKNLKIFVCLICLMLILPIFVGCNEIPKLATPEKVSVWEQEDKFYINITAVENADYYMLNINEREIKVTATQYDATDIIGQSGNYQIKFKAFSFTSNYVSSDYSEVLTFSSMRKLGAPSIRVVNNTLFWTAIENAKYYVVNVNGSTFITEKISFDLINDADISQFIRLGETNIIKIYAKGTSDYTNSEESNQITIKVE